ncbi:bifunctional 4-hydroxy-2-oxoglutarate aldolase/2-dehydro-3-deoxy-phosphogluconate aldolase [Pedomonas mirosovicensis]|uniref:bifunctional 4-hydroxy-2-oxoglutarate aldolase/2-dehydro-3-deoxy-phosphogluconate aldolase n=1 Tax=Pedomonas mirosovicensis TaxID=2908641 RepID=UPI002168E431|nr:bifunctional 4-hydroxy-2-oxoglutarate aldolase/2-dehydro-3-deoxy-phosphogluconate aldolase [Pedomonas mirosovicensis]MCH8686273.1 bifunctional 4-hydroxy-2-oxoglutarate aldolase/2-dehydro-3-deoxy-phosphogluconate aldolase [Pedomonas mirosovicensis]
MPEPAIRAIMQKAPVIPVLAIDNADHAEPLAEALVAGGLPVIEVTLRTSAALEAIRRMARVEGAVVGAGTVLDPDGLARAADSGAQFIVSPGLTDRLAVAAHAAKVPFLPGVATAGDIMRALDHGLTHLKFFPAESSGGANAVKSLAGPFGAVRFCPTGGITLMTAPDYLTLPNVLCVGGTWIVPKEALARQDWSTIRRLAEQAAALGRV